MARGTFNTYPLLSSSLLLSLSLFLFLSLSSFPIGGTCSRTLAGKEESAVETEAEETQENDDSSSTHISDHSRIAVFALGSFWHGEAVFGCIDGVLRTTSGYCGGSKLEPEYRSTGDHAESVQVEYDPDVVKYEQLLDTFWSSHDPTQVFGQGPDVGYQYRSIIFVQNEEERNLAKISKEKEQDKLENLVTTKIQDLGIFYPAEMEHQKFELRRRPLLMQLIRGIGEEDFSISNLATKLNAYAAGSCLGRKTQTVLDYEVANFQKVLSRFHEISLN